MAADIVVRPLHHSRTYVFADESLQRDISDHFSFEVPGAQYMQAVKRRHWDGRIRVYHLPTQTLPTGLIPRLEAFATAHGYSVDVALPSSQTAWSAFDTEALLTRYPVPHEVRDYQKAGITYALHQSRCVLLSPTASGKSLVLYYLVRQRMSVGPVLLIVPTISLVSQMFTDWRDYGWTEVADAVHCITGGIEKDTEKPVVISTWQSIFKQPEAWFARYTTLLGDEAHTFKADSLQSIMDKLPHCGVRIGVTGTLDDAKANLLLVEGSFGPAHRVARTKDLQTQGHLTPITIQGHLLQYGAHDKWQIKEHHRTYQEEIQYLVAHPGRMRWMVDFIRQLRGNVLVLYTLVEKHGLPLYEAVRAAVGQQRPVYFVSGAVDGLERERVRGLLEATEHIVLDFGTQHIRCAPTERVPLADGTTKPASEVTVEDDLDDKWCQRVWVSTCVSENTKY